MPRVTYKVTYKNKLIAHFNGVKGERSRPDYSTSSLADDSAIQLTNDFLSDCDFSVSDFSG